MVKTNTQKKIEISDPRLQQISTINSSILINYVRKFLGESFLESLFHGILDNPAQQYYYLDSPIDILFFESGNGWMPNEISLQFFKNLQAMGVELFDVGKFAVSHSDKLNNIAIQSLLHFMGPVKTIRKVGKINRMFNRTKEVQLIRFHKTGGTIKLLYKAGVKHTKLVTDYNMGVYVGVLKQIGYDDVQVICEEDNFTAKRPYTILAFSWANKRIWYRLKWIAGLYLTQWLARDYMKSHHGINKYHNNIINNFHTEIRKKEQALKEKDRLFQVLQQERADAEAILENKIAEKTQALEEKKQQLSQEIQLKDEQFANISHELKNPVMLVKSPLTQLLSGEYLSAKQTETIQFVLNNVARLETLLQKIIQIEKIKSTEDINKNWLWLSAEVQNITQPMIYQAQKEKQINITVTCPQDLWIEFDPEYLNLIIANILGNAIKFSPQKSNIALQIKQQNNNKIQVSCTDNGPGIKPQEIDKIFSKYYRSNKTQETEGSGLGLYLVKQLLEKLSGTVAVASEENSYTTFTISFPVQLEYRDNSAQEGNTKAINGNKAYTIVIVEDDPVLKTYLMETLSDDAQCIGAENGREGLEKIKLHRPDLILTDLKLPNLSGEELIQQIRDNPFTCTIPIVVLTSSNYTDLDSKLTSQINDYIEKPISVDILKTRISNQLQTVAETTQANVFVIEHISDYKKALTQEETELINRINDILVSHYQDSEFRVADLAQTLNLTAKTLQRKLSAIMTTTPHNLIKNTRLYFAKQMLSETEQAIGTIAYQCGFRSDSAFTNAFKQQYQLSPTNFLKNKSF